MHNKKASRIGVLAAALVLALTACAGPTTEGGDDTTTAPKGGTLTIGAQLDNNSFDTAALEIGNRVQYWQPVYDTLIHLDTTATPQPGLATEWSYNEDNTVLSLTLREDVTFTDGEVFDGEAVKANIEHLKSGGGQNSFMVASVDEVVVNSATQVDLMLSAPNPALVNYLGVVGGAMASPAAIESGTLAQNPIGSGPYVYNSSESVTGTTYVYDRNPDYWDIDAFPYEKVVVTPITDITPRLNALKTGQVNATFLAPAVAAEAEGSGATIETLPVNWAGFIIGDRDGTIVPELADPLVRQAINFAIDKEGLLDAVLLGYGEVTSQVFNANSQAFVEDMEDTYTYNPDKARELLDEAGVESFSITMPQSPGPYTPLYTIVQQQLAEVGITVNYDQVPPDQIISSVLSAKYPMFFLPLGSASAWQDIQTWVAPTAPWNMFKVSDPELDALIAEAQLATGDEQDALFQEINTWLIENAWFAPFFTPDNVFGTTPDVSVEMQAQNSVPFLSSYAPAG